jgi:hypothetical protein
MTRNKANVSLMSEDCGCLVRSGIADLPSVNHKTGTLSHLVLHWIPGEQSTRSMCVDATRLVQPLEDLDAHAAFKVVQQRNNPWKLSVLGQWLTVYPPSSDASPPHQTAGCCNRLTRLV